MVIGNFRILGKPREDEWPENNVSIKYDSFEIKNKIEISALIPNLCENAYDLIMVSCDICFFFLFDKCFVLIVIFFWIVEDVDF